MATDNAKFDQSFYNLRNIGVRFETGVIVNIVSASIARKLMFDKKHPGQSLVPSQAYLGEDLPDCTFEVYNDDLISFGGIIPNSPMTGFVVYSMDDADNQSFFGSDFLTKFPLNAATWGAPSTDLGGDKISTTKFPINFNVLNPGADGGFSGAEPGGD